MAKAIDLGKKDKAMLNLLMEQFYLRDNEEIVFDYQLGNDLRKLSYTPGDLLLLAAEQNKQTIETKIGSVIMRSVSALIFNRIFITGLLTSILLSADLLSGFLN